MFRVKNGAWAPLNESSMPSYPATGMTCISVITGVLFLMLFFWPLFFFGFQRRHRI
jgi:hypothetical protein